jgi:type I restriction enzyme S subunit
MPRFLFYWARASSFVGEVVARSTGVSYPAINASEIGNLPFPLLALDHQQTIADYLDCKTAEIDALIAKKRRMIDLLHEKRQALISEAVTKGLEPDVPMKDSGIEWLGRIPSHWTLTRLKYIAPNVTVGIVVTPVKYYVNEGIPCLRSLNVKETGLRNEDLVFINEDSNLLHSKSIIRSGDLVSVRTGQPGTTAIVDSRFDGANCIDLIIVRRCKTYSTSYLCNYMNSDVAKAQYSAGSSGAIQQHFNVETASNLLVPLPPKPEQDALAEHISKECDRIDFMETKISEQISKLLEYRQTLISAAVTGKIDVRGGGGL